MNLNAQQSQTRRLSTLAITVLSVLLMSGCGKKDEKQQSDPAPAASAPPAATAPAPAGPVTPPAPAIGTYFEDTLPGTALTPGDYTSASYKLMVKNMSGDATITINTQNSFDYTIYPNQASDSAPKINRQSGTQNEPPKPSALKAQGGEDGSWGRMSITFMPTPNSGEPWHTYVFQYQTSIAGILLKSTDQIALFKAVDPTPYGVDLLKVAYTSQNPAMQRFRIEQLNPFQMGPQMPGGNYGSIWLHVVNQTLTSSFQLIQH